MVAGSGCRVSATADWLAVRAVWSELVSGGRIPELQGNYREILVGDTGLQAAAMEPINPPPI
jgi:hypothetical protein